MIEKIVIAGANGFLGSNLRKHFSSRVKKIVLLSRSPIPIDQSREEWIQWDGETPGAWTKALDGSDAVINLAGKNVNCRYTDENKRLIYHSRLASTRALGTAIAQCSRRPKVWLNASSATIYNASHDKMMTEATGVVGDDFSMDVCKQWEKAFFDFERLDVRQIAMRTSIVLGWDGPALQTLANLVKFGLGGVQGDGKQFCSWIHVDDFCRAVDWFITNQQARGVYNVTAPDPVTNHEFMRQLRNELHVPLGLPSPKWLLEFGAFFLRTETELVLKSRKVYPERLLNEGFTFDHPSYSKAIEALCEEKKTKA